MGVAAGRLEPGSEIGDRVLARSVVDDDLSVVAAGVPLLAKGVDVPDHVHRRRVARRKVLGFDLGAALRAVELQDATEGRVRGEGELVLLGVRRRRENHIGIAVVDQRSLLVVAAGVAEVLAADPAQPPFGVEIDEQVLRHGNAHGALPFAEMFWVGHGGSRYSASVSSRSPAAEISKVQPLGTLAVKKGPSTMAGPDAVAPGCWSSRV